jgi:hypothetical protein
MNRRKFLFGALAVCSALSFTGCSKEDDGRNDNNITGYLYTTTNGENTNNVVRFTRLADGSLTGEKAYTTNSKGGANVAAGGDAHGDFDAQGSVQIIGDYLLSVNAGGNQVSVFGLDKKTGELSFKNNVSSAGVRPVSIAYHMKSGSSSEYWVVVANQWNNPNVQKDGAAIERYPDNAFHMMDLTMPDVSDNERNIQLFTFSTATGSLTNVGQLDHYVRENGGPTTVSFSSDGSKLAVSTWGIAHFGTKLTSLDEQHASRVYVYNFSGGAVSGKRYFEETGIAGTIGFSWEKTGNSKMYVSNFNLIPSKLDNSVTVLTDNGSTVSKTGNFGATPTADINEACWTALSPAGDKVFVASFQTNLVSVYNTNGAGLSYSSYATRGDLAPPGDSKELWVTPDGRYVYNLGSFQSYSINRFDLNGSSAVYKKQNILSTTSDGKGIPGKYNFLGLTGFDLQ